MNVAIFINSDNDVLEVHHPECRDIKRKLSSCSNQYTSTETIQTTSQTIAEDALHQVTEDWYCGEQNEDGSKMWVAEWVKVYPCCHNK